MSGPEWGEIEIGPSTAAAGRILGANEVLDEAIAILIEIVPAGATRPRVGVKVGGWTAAYYPAIDTIRVRVDTWKKMFLAQKRLIMVHEYIHARMEGAGIGHRAEFAFVHALDALSFIIYRRIWGDDAPMREFTAALERVADRLPTSRRFA